ncbi:hypothetical protein [Arthrobacter sp. B6]|uniref:hypothetical protein n=1 Tax=Arthrobacter sp. B6 TaxID=1570137 RepID=UPI000833D5B2|nr:hypothetical protein [Arthrobacter sp. B6]
MFGSLVYSIGALSVILIVLALGFIDSGNVRKRNVLDTWVVKVIGAMIAGLGTILVGYSFWQWSFYQAFGVPNALGQAISDWWIGGQFQSTPSINIGSEVLPGADAQQVFVVFFATFSMATLALIHGGVLERVRPRVLYVMAAVIGLALSPLASYLTWGPVGPLTQLGIHDFEGIYPLYIFSAVWVLVMSWRLGPRLGAFAPHSTKIRPKKHNSSLIGIGVLLIMFALPFVALSATWIIPGTGVYGISFAETGWGIIIMNVVTAFVGGGLSGALLAHWKKEAGFGFVGPIAGVVMSGTLLDIGTPLEVLILSVFGPFVAYLVSLALVRLGIDDQKVIPLGLGPGVVGAIATGFIAWGTKTGGYPGLEGAYALHSAEVTPLGQAAGVGAVALLAAIPCLIICLIFERFGGLRVPEQVEIAGLDAAHWKTENFADELLETEKSASADSPSGRP